MLHGIIENHPCMLDDNPQLGAVQLIVPFAKHNKNIFHNKQTTVLKSNLTINTEMPPKMILGVRPPSPIETQQWNKDQIANAPKSHHSHAKMEAICLETAQKKKITEEEAKGIEACCRGRG